MHTAAFYASHLKMNLYKARVKEYDRITTVVCVCVCVSVVLPGCSYNGGVEASIAGQSHSNGDGPAHHTKSVVCKCLKSETQAGLVRLQFQLIHMHLVLHLISFVFVYS